MNGGKQYTQEQMDTAARVAMVVSRIPEGKQGLFLTIAESILLGVSLAERPQGGGVRAGV